MMMMIVQSTPVIADTLGTAVFFVYVVKYATYANNSTINAVL